MFKLPAMVGVIILVFIGFMKYTDNARVGRSWEVHFTARDVSSAKPHQFEKVLPVKTQLACEYINKSLEREFIQDGYSEIAALCINTYSGAVDIINESPSTSIAKSNKPTK